MKPYSVANAQGTVRDRVVQEMPGLYFVGLEFLYAGSSEQIHGVGRDAAHIADVIAARRGDSRHDPQGADQHDQPEAARLQRSS